MFGIEIDPQRLLLEGMESGEFPDLKPLALAREYALEHAQGNPGQNEIVRWWHSPEGFYYEFKQFPAAFYGRLGLVQVLYIALHQCTNSATATHPNNRACSSMASVASSPTTCPLTPPLLATAAGADRRGKPGPARSVQGRSPVRR